MLMFVLLAELALSTAVVVTLAVRVRRLRCDLGEARDEVELVKAQACEVNQCNYHLACALYGQSAVDHAIRQVNRDGNN